MKTCTKCMGSKSVDQFFSDSTKKDGRSPSCIACYKIYYESVRDRRLKQKKAYRAENSASISEYRVDHYARNREKSIQYASDYAKENPDRRRAIESCRRARKNGAGGSFTADDLAKIVESQKWKCACCKKSIKHGYHADHIQPLARGGSGDKYNIQALCPTCNMSKGAKDPYVFMQSKGKLL